MRATASKLEPACVYVRVVDINNGDDVLFTSFEEEEMRFHSI